MDREEAIAICKEIRSKIPELSPQGIAIMESRPNSSVSMGCTVNLTGLCEDSIRKIKQLIKSYALEVNEGDNYLIIYTSNILSEEM